MMAIIRKTISHKKTRRDGLMSCDSVFLSGFLFALVAGLPPANAAYAKSADKNENSANRASLRRIAQRYPNKIDDKSHRYGPKKDQEKPVDDFHVRRATLAA
jgi:hypothetical protein